MPEFKNKEEYEKWKAEKLKKAQEIAESKKIEQITPAINDKSKVSIKISVKNIIEKTASTFKTKLKFIFLFSIIALVSIFSVFLYQNYIEKSPETIFRKNKNSVVMILTSNLFGENEKQGSGFIVSENGVIATNYHVIKNAAAVKIKTADDRLLDTTGVIYVDEDNDISLLKVKVKENVILPKIKIGDATKLVVGEKIYVISNPHGLESTFTEGIVSGKREIKSGLNLIQITAPISPGSSGGPVINKYGKVVGVATFLLEGSQNLNFAYPINLIQDPMQSENIIYTFPNLKAGWKYIEKSEEIEPYLSEYISSSKAISREYYYDPDSVISLAEGIKGVWIKMKLNSSIEISAPLINVYDQFYFSSVSFAFIELDCFKQRARMKTVFYIDSINNKTTVSDFSKDNPWDNWKQNSIVDKISTVLCASN